MIWRSWMLNADKCWLATQQSLGTAKNSDGWMKVTRKLKPWFLVIGVPIKSVRQEMVEHGQLFDINTAPYYRTDSAITSGTANASVTFTINYPYGQGRLPRLVMDAVA